MNKHSLTAALIASVFAASSVHALDLPAPSSSDPRIRVVTYKSDDVILVKVQRGVVTRILLEPGEQILIPVVGLSSNCDEANDEWHFLLIELLEFEKILIHGWLQLRDQPIPLAGMRPVVTVVEHPLVVERLVGVATQQCVADDQYFQTILELILYWAIEEFVKRVLDQLLGARIMLKLFHGFLIEVLDQISGEEDLGAGTADADIKHSCNLIS